MSYKTGATANRELLDRLMGTNRNAPLGSARSRRENWKHEKMCVSFLCGWCPFEAFKGTKFDFGACNKTHLAVARVEFDAANWKSAREYWLEYKDVLQRVQNELDFRTRRAHERLLAQHAFDRKHETLNKKFNKNDISSPAIDKVRSRINEIKSEAEILADSGKVSESQKLLTKLRVLVQVESDLVMEESKKLPHTGLFNGFAVCDVCGGLQDQTPDKLQMHNYGKIHRGFLIFHEELKKCKKKFIENKDDGKLGSRSRSVIRDRSRSRQGSRSRSQRRRPRRRQRRSRSRSYSSSGSSGSSSRSRTSRSRSNSQ